MNKNTYSTTTLVALFAALTAVLGMIPKIDLPTGVPITPQTLGVMLAGCLIGPRRALYSQALFLFAVAAGLPLLSGGRGGLGVFASPSVGYLIGWPTGALVTGWVMSNLPHSSPEAAARAAALASVAGGVIIVHAFGVLGLMTVVKLTLGQAVIGTLLFVPGDLVKCLLCAVIVRSVASGLPRWTTNRGGA
jgi:biotin transport system substrate-specific component